MSPDGDGGRGAVREADDGGFLAVGVDLLSQLDGGGSRPVEPIDAVDRVGEVSIQRVAKSVQGDVLHRRSTSCRVAVRKR